MADASITRIVRKVTLQGHSRAERDQEIHIVGLAAGYYLVVIRIVVRRATTCRSALGTLTVTAIEEAEPDSDIELVWWD